MDNREDKNGQRYESAQSERRRNNAPGHKKSQPDSFFQQCKILLAQFLLLLKDLWDKASAAAVSGWKRLSAWCVNTWNTLSARLKKADSSPKAEKPEIPEREASAAKQKSAEQEAQPSRPEEEIIRKPEHRAMPHLQSMEEIEQGEPVTFSEIRDAAKKSSNTWEDILSVAQMVWVWAYRLRGVLLSIPVAVAAISLAIQNMARLPSRVGLDLLASGEFEFMVSKSIAVLGPLAVTAVSILLMFCSRRVLYPWLISVFTLVLPVVIWITNVFPA